LCFSPMPFLSPPRLVFLSVVSFRDTYHHCSVCVSSSSFVPFLTRTVDDR
jgi:hypothetical protein